MMRSIAAILALCAACGACFALDDPSGTAARASPAAASPGKQVFDKWCTPCHGRGSRHPGTASLAARYGKDLPAALEDRQDLTPEVVGYFVRNGVSVMPPFRKTEITDADLAALGAYLSHEPGK